MAHKIGAAFHLPHGLANALLISNVIRYNANDNPTKQAAFSQYDRPKAKCRYAEVADHLGLGGTTKDEKVANLIQWVDDLKKQLDIPPSIQEAGVSEADFLAKLKDVSIDAFDDQCTGANPRYPLIAELRAILLDSFYGRPFVELTERIDLEVPAEKPAHKAKAADARLASKAEAKLEEALLSK
jgi:acetaldehyde dehydrogenase/alcohol dehydrogenase